MTPAKIRLYKGVKRVNGKIYGYEKVENISWFGTNFIF